MGTDQSVGASILRSSFYDKVIKQVVARKYKFKQALTISTTGAWKNYFYRENTTTLNAQSGNAIRGIPRGAAFPQAVVEWDLINTTIEKYGLEDNIFWEDIISDDVAVQQRTLVRIAEGVAKSVDDQIYSALTTDSGIQTFTIGPNTTTTSGAWNESSAAIIDDLARATQLFAEADYDTDRIMVFVNPRDRRSIMKYLTDKGAQFPRLAENVAENGNFGNLMGFEFVESRSVSASQALVVIPQRCGNWKQLVPLQTTTKEDPYKSVTIRSVELGVTQVTDPLAVCLIKGTLSA